MMATGQSPYSSDRSDPPEAPAGLMSFMAEQLVPGERIRAVLRKTKTTSLLALLLDLLMSMIWPAESVATHLAIVVTNQRVFVVDLGSSSVELVSARQSVEVVRATPADVRLRFDGAREILFAFDKDFRQEADDVIRALATPAARANPVAASSPAKRSLGARAGAGSSGSQSDDTGVWPSEVHRGAADSLALFLGLPLGVLLMLGVLVPLGEPDAAEVTFLFSLVVIIVGVTFGALLRGAVWRPLSLAGEAILGLGLGVGIGFVLEFFVSPLGG
jgi:hypothetical protein